MKQIATILALISIALILFGCITVNPADLSKTAPDSNTGTQKQGSASDLPKQVTLDLQTISKHSTAGDCWMIIDGKVYDLSSYTTHPGGMGFTAYCGKDGSIAYNTLDGRGRDHSAFADSQLAGYLIGTLGQEALNLSQGTNTQAAQSPAGNTSNKETENDDYEDD